MQRTGFNNARVRQANKSIFLSHLWREKQLSKSQLSQLTGLSIPAVSNILAELLSEGLIGHTTEHLSKRGVNSGSYQIPEHGAWTLCMNITPTSIEYQLADARLLAAVSYTHLSAATRGQKTSGPETPAPAPVPHRTSSASPSAHSSCPQSSAASPPAPPVQQSSD